MLKRCSVWVVLIVSGGLVLGEAAVAHRGAHAQEGVSLADDLRTGATVAVVVPERADPGSSFVTLSTGNLVFIRGQRFVVTAEPAPSAVFDESPPPPQAAPKSPSDPPAAGAIWVPGYWAPSGDDLVWVEGCYVAPKPGHAFVPPRWVLVAERYLFFDGFYVPYRVWVRSFFHTFHFSGNPNAQASAAHRDRGPYWPIGFRGPSVSVSRVGGRGPYWPLGLGPPTRLNLGGAAAVGLPNNGRR